MFGYDEASLCSLTFQDITHPEDLAVDLHLLEACLAGERSDYRMDKRYRRSDGSYLSCGLTVVLVRGPDGCPLYFISQMQQLPATAAP
jgi:PAS domain S-box-containing protein